MEAFSGDVIYTNPESPPRLYAKLSSDVKPILRANVVAIINR